MDVYRVAVNSMALDGKLPHGDRRWAVFNDSFVNQHVTILDLANSIYTGHAYAAWHDGRRRTDNFISAQHVGIDMDTGDDRSRIDTLKQHDLVKMFGALIHTTPSHTEQNPRARIVFLLDQPVEDPIAYGAVVSFILTQFGSSDESCKDASRFFYGSQNCEIWWDDRLPNVLPLAYIRTLYARWRKTQPEQETPQRTNNKIVRLDDARAQRVEDATTKSNSPATLDDITRALATIDPWSIDYNRWIGVIAALKREYGDAAMMTAVNWAQGKNGEVEREWARLDTDRANSMHVGTILYMARG